MTVFSRVSSVMVLSPPESTVFLSMFLSLTVSLTVPFAAALPVFGGFGFFAIATSTT